MIDLTEHIGRFRIICTVCDFHTEYEFENLEAAVKVAEAHRAENPEHPKGAVLVFTPATTGSLCHGHMRSKRRRTEANSAVTLPETVAW